MNNRNINEESLGLKKRLIVALSSSPPDVPITTFASLVIIIILLYGTLWGLLGSIALPGGSVFALFVLVNVCYLGGQLLRLCKIPTLVGMILFGIILRNAPYINIADDIPEDWADAIRNVSLVLILLRAGLEMDPELLRSNIGVCLRLMVLPFVFECVAAAVCAHFLLGLPWIWAFLLGFMLAAVSAAVILPIMVKLQKKGIGVASGIPTLMIAVAGISNAIALTGFEAILGITFATGSLAWTISKGPIEMLIGIAFGVLLGILIWYIPNPHEKSTSVFRILILICGGMFIMFGSQAVDYGGAGALGCICLTFVAALRWKLQENEKDNHDPVGDVLDISGRIIEPFLFGLIGSEIRINEMQPSIIGFAMATLFAGLAMRMIVSVIAALGSGLTVKEQVFVTFAGLPKATVQAAIGPVALSYARKRNLGPEIEEYGMQLLTVAVLSILVTAPLGAALITLLAPRLLDKNVEDATSEKEKSPLPETIESLSVDAFGINIYNKDCNIYAVARL